MTEAEDVLQDTFVRVQTHADQPIDNPKSYLTTIVTRLCLKQLNAARTQRETYLGPRLPEPVMTTNQPELINPAERAVTYDSISTAFLVLLESLSPAERAVFILHQVFEYKFKEIGAMLEKSEAACRQLFKRAKEHISENRPRFNPAPEEHTRLLDSFIEVVELGEVETFLQLLAEDVVFVPDGGGERGAATRILRGQEAVATFIFGVQRVAPSALVYKRIVLNGQQSILARTSDGYPFFVLFIYGEHHKAQLILVIAGRKLQSLAESLDSGSTSRLASKCEHS
ncbi:MAG: sigma-70 family RNA polymerase sigma factor [Anaerolineae bacterium]|nr:sigma-70 family RNA polymerase sigma factor [Anaerolineae bacterium]